jgi:hypothetical protein
MITEEGKAEARLLLQRLLRDPNVEVHVHRTVHKTDVPNMYTVDDTVTLTVKGKEIP